MSSDDRAYHLRRAAKQRMIADRCTDPAVADVHRTLANLHEQRADQPAGMRPKLHMVMPIG